MQVFSNNPPSTLASSEDEKARKEPGLTGQDDCGDQSISFMPGFRKILLLFQLVIWHWTSIQNLIREELKISAQRRIEIF